MQYGGINHLFLGPLTVSTFFMFLGLKGWKYINSSEKGGSGSLLKWIPRKYSNLKIKYQPWKESRPFRARKKIRNLKQSTVRLRLMEMFQIFDNLPYIISLHIHTHIFHWLNIGTIDFVYKILNA